MKRVIFVVFICLISIFAVFAEEPTVKISGNIYAGLKADITEEGSQIYAWEDSNGTPIWANFRVDASSEFAGATLNLRATDTGISQAVNGRALPFVNRAFLWARTKNDYFKVRTGYLWDSDFESSYNAWDTASNYEWVTELSSMPLPFLKLGVTVPTPWNKAELIASLQNITYGIAVTPPGFRISVMGEYGAEDALRSINYGIDCTLVPNLLIRTEGDFQQLGVPGAGYYELFEQVAYTILDALTIDMQAYEWLYKDGTPNKFVVYPNVTLLNKGVSYFVGAKFTIQDEAVAKEFEASVKAPIAKNVSVKGGAYVTAAPETPTAFSPYVEFVGTF